MEVWALLSLGCFKAEESKMYLTGQRHPGRSHFPWVVLWAWSDLETVKPAHLDLHDGRRLRTELVSARCTAVRKLEASGPAIYFSLGSLNASHVRTHLFHGWQCCVKVVSRINSLHLHKWGLLFCKYLRMCRTVISVGLNRTSEVQWGAFAASTPQALSSALSFVHRASPDWKMRWDVCHCHANLHCSACSSAVCNTAGYIEEGCAGPNWHPAGTCLNRDHTSLCFGSSRRVGVRGEGTESSTWLKPEKQEQYVCIFLAVVRMSWVALLLQNGFSVKLRYGSPWQVTCNKFSTNLDWTQIFETEKFHIWGFTVELFSIWLF